MTIDPYRPLANRAPPPELETRAMTTAKAAPKAAKPAAAKAKTTAAKTAARPKGRSKAEQRAESLEQMLDASNERSRLQEKQAEVLQAEVDRLRSEMQACTRDSAHAIARANADRDLALARALPLESTVQLMRSQMRVLVDQLGASSALAADVLGESVEQAHRILGADQDCSKCPLVYLRACLHTHTHTHTHLVRGHLHTHTHLVRGH